MPGYRNRSQVPPLAVAALQDGHACVGGGSAQLAGGADAGEPGPHDQDVDVLGRLG